MSVIIRISQHFYSSLSISSVCASTLSLNKLVTYLTLALCLPVIAMTSASALEPSTIVYEVELDSEVLGKATLGRIETKLTQQGDTFSVATRTKAGGYAAMLRPSLAETCTFTISENRAQSAWYTGGTPEKTEYSVDFQWGERKVLFSTSDDTMSLDMPQGYLVDNCNMPFAFAMLHDQEIDETVYIVDGKKARIRGFQFQSKSRELLNTKLGSLETIKVVFTRELKPERSLTVWLSKEHDYLPVKIQESRKSRTTTLLVRDYEAES